MAAKVILFLVKKTMKHEHGLALNDRFIWSFMKVGLLI
jgi:hypothetical protein